MRQLAGDGVDVGVLEEVQEKDDVLGTLDRGCVYDVGSDLVIAAIGGDPVDATDGGELERAVPWDRDEVGVVRQRCLDLRPRFRQSAALGHARRLLEADDPALCVDRLGRRRVPDGDRLDGPGLEPDDVFRRKDGGRGNQPNEGGREGSVEHRVSPSILQGRLQTPDRSWGSSQAAVVSSGLSAPSESRP